jgi:hypothetical protein
MDVMGMVIRQLKETQEQEIATASLGIDERRRADIRAARSKILE